MSQAFTDAYFLLSSIPVARSEPEPDDDFDVDGVDLTSAEVIDPDAVMGVDDA